MWFNQNQIQKDLEQIASAEFVPWEMLREKTVLITGATGLIGYAVVTGMLYTSRLKGLNIRVLALVRDLTRAQARFSEWLGQGDLSFYVGCVEKLPTIEEPIDYIIHGASQTASKAFIHQAVETIHTSVIGTDNLLKLALEKNCAGFLYMSSMEVYGHPPKGHKVKETDVGAFDPRDLRNSYPIGKQLCENLCCAYASEYGVSATIIRLTQTFGAGVNYNDSRVFAEFGRCVTEKRDIVLKTKGETERCYLYIVDAVTAVLTVLLLGVPGQAYNAADENTYCSIAEMAQQIAKLGGIQVRFELQDEKKLGYPSVIYMDLNTSKLQDLGWIPRGDDMNLMGIFEAMIGERFFYAGNDKKSI